MPLGFGCHPPRIGPVWNKSNHERMIIKRQSGDVRAEADAAIAALGFTGTYDVDADHIGFKTGDAFFSGKDFFSLDRWVSPARRAFSALDFCTSVLAQLQKPATRRAKGLIIFKLVSMCFISFSFLTP